MEGLLGELNEHNEVIYAKKRKIPIFHMEAGNRCFDLRVPEETNRKIVDHLSDINLPLSEHARNYLLAEGIKPETIIKIGSPMMEVLNANMEKIKSSNIIDTEGLKDKEYILISVHREENVDSEKNFSDFLDSIDAISKVYNLPIIISTHPRTRKKLEVIGYEKNNKLIIVERNGRSSELVSELKSEQNSLSWTCLCARFNTAKMQMHCFSPDFSSCFLKIAKCSQSSIMNVSL